MPQPATTTPDTPPQHPLRELLTIALPTVVTMTSFTLMQMVDKVMVSRIDPDPIYVGALGNGGLASFVPIALMMGVISVVNSFTSQNLGAGKASRAPAYAWNAFWIAAIYWAILLIPFALLLPTLFRLLGHDARRVALEAAYAQPLVFCAIWTLGARCLSQFFYGMHRPRVVLAAGVTGNIANVICNSLFIYGPNGPHAAQGEPGIFAPWFSLCARVCETLHIPPLGVAGAAYGTVIGTFLEMLIPLCVFLAPAAHKAYATRTTWKPSPAHMKEILKLGWAAGAMFGNEMICWATFMVVFVGKFGEHHSTAGWIAHQWMSVSFMPAVGISVAVTATVGKCMGMRRPDLAAQRAWLGTGISIIYMGCMAIVFIVFRRQLTAIFLDAGTTGQVREEILRLGGQFLIATAAFQLFDAIAMALSGALRGAGDTVWPGVVTVVLSWSIIVGLGYAIMTLAPGLSSLGPWIAAAIYIALLSMAMLWRFLQGHWRTKSLVHDDAALSA